MRAGGCTLQQALTQEAATVVKQSVNLARRRGHAQVTPLHVASTMLSSSSGLFRAACLQSHSHPLQCKALELCFNVALNRLPASSSSSPMLGHHHHHHYHPPALSNALVAAFKRAQAHQRRGSIESQQQPLLAVKIEIEQLVISILDDPSVSRVMREAGFSSTHVKTNVEHAVSMETNPSPSTPTNNSTKSKQEGGRESSVLLIGALQEQTLQALDQGGGKEATDDDVTSVVDCLVSRKKRSVVVVGECLATTEGVVKKFIDKVEKGEVPELLKSVQFISLPLFSFAHLSKQEVEQKVGELRCLVKSCCVGRGAVLYLGDLKWAAEYRASCGEKGRNYYCPVEHVIMELGRMVGGDGSSLGGRFWFVGIATYQTYMRCRVGRPSLESLWGLHPLTIPAGSLGLSLSHDSYLQSSLKNKRCVDGSHWSSPSKDRDQNICQDYCSSKSTQTLQLTTATPSLPSWLQQYKEDSKRTNSNDKEQLQARDLFSNLNGTHQIWPIPLKAKHPWSNEHYIWISDASEECKDKTTAFFSSQDTNMTRPSLLCQTNPSPNPVSSSSSDTMEMEHHHRFKELNAENLKTLCIALEKKVPWQVDIIPVIASTILQCRSGMLRRKDKSNPSRAKEDTWLFFQGCDVEGKEIISRELANLVFGSKTRFVSIGSSSFSSTKSDSSDDLNTNKRSRSEANYTERFGDAILDNPHRVFLMVDMEQVEYSSQVGMRSAMESGRVRCSSGEEVGLEDAIVILSCESFDSRSRACSPPRNQKSESEQQQKEVEEEEENKDSDELMEKEATNTCLVLDLNISVEDGDDVLEDLPFDGIGLLESVDRSFFFKMREDFMT